MTEGDTHSVSSSHICCDSQLLCSLLTGSSHGQSPSFLGSSSLYAAHAHHFPASMPSRYCIAVWKVPLTGVSAPYNPTLFPRSCSNTAPP